MVLTAALRCDPSTDRSLPATMRCRSCRTACRAASRTGNAGESARRRQTDHKSLQNSESGICLHQTNQTQDRLRSHETVGIERDRELVISAPSLAEIANVAGLVPCIHGAPPV